MPETWKQIFGGCSGDSMNTVGNLTVREVLQDASPELRPLTGELGLERPVSGVMVADIEDPTPWMATSTLLMTSGTTFAGSVEAGVRLLERLDRAGAAALGVGIGVCLDHVHPEMVSNATRFGIPVFEVPYHVPFSSIAHYVHAALASTDLLRLKRTLAVESRLLDLVLDDKSVHEIMGILSGILNMSVLLFDSRGDALWSSSEGGPDAWVEEVWSKYQEAKRIAPFVGSAQLRHHLLSFQTVCLREVPEQLIVAATQDPIDTAFVQAALSSAARIVQLRLIREAEREAVERRMQAVLLDDVLCEHGSAEELEHRLLDNGLDLRSGFSVLVTELSQPSLEGSQPSDHQLFEAKSSVVRSIAAFADRRHEGAISQFSGTRVVTLLAKSGIEAPAPTHECLDLLRFDIEAVWGGKVSLGASSTGFSVDEVRRGYRQASEASRFASANSQGALVCIFDEMSEPLSLLAGEGDEALRAIAERYVVRLQEHDEIRHGQLLRTLTVFLQNDMSTQKTADTLYLHRNSLEKRLRRIEGLLDVDLRCTHDVVQVYLALKAQELLLARQLSDHL